MTAALAIRTVFELAVVLLIIFGLFNEDKLIIFEHKIYVYMTKKIMLSRRRRLAAQRVERNSAGKNREPKRAA